MESISSLPTSTTAQASQPSEKDASLLSKKPVQINLKKAEEVTIRPITSNIKSAAKSVGTISILNTNKPKVQEVESVSVTQEVCSAQFSIDQLRKAWLDYTATIPTETILVSSMKSCSVELMDNFKIKVVVTNADQQQRLRDRRDSLLPYLRSVLKNTYIDMEVHVSASSARRTIFSPRDKLNYMATRNPNIATLYKEFDLEIM